MEERGWSPEKFKRCGFECGTGRRNWLGHETPPEEGTRIGNGGPYRPETTYHGAEGRDQLYLFHDLSWGQVSSPFT